MKSQSILLIHGFGGGPHEIIRLKSSLEYKGYHVETPLLSGHGGTREELASSRYKDWLESAKDSYSHLMDNFEQVSIIGFSMGGLICANLIDNYEPCSFITINTPIYYWNINQILDNITQDFLGSTRKYIKVSTNKPLISLIEFLKILYRSKKKFHNIKCPTLIIQSLDDDTVNPKSAEYIYDSIKGIKKKFYYRRGGHIILQSGWVNDISERIDKFIKENKK